jgi:hypothetical protein
MAWHNIILFAGYEAAPEGKVLFQVMKVLNKERLGTLILFSLSKGSQRPQTEDGVPRKLCLPAHLWGVFITNLCGMSDADHVVFLF